MEKGSDVVVLNKCDYSKKLDEIVLYKTRFEEIQHNVNFLNTKTCKLVAWIVQKNKVIYYCRN